MPTPIKFKKINWKFVLYQLFKSVIFLAISRCYETVFFIIFKKCIYECMGVHVCVVKVVNYTQTVE